MRIYIRAGGDSYGTGKRYLRPRGSPRRLQIDNVNAHMTMMTLRHQCLQLTGLKLARISTDHMFLSTAAAACTKGHIYTMTHEEQTKPYVHFQPCVIANVKLSIYPLATIRNNLDNKL